MQYREPTQQSTEIEIDPMYFNMASLTSEMIVQAAKPDNHTINFTVDSEAMDSLAIGSAQSVFDSMGIENINYGDVHFSATLNEDTGCISVLTLSFDATMSLQGYSVKAEYYIDYAFET